MSDRKCRLRRRTRRSGRSSSGWQEVELRDKVKTAGGRWNPARRLWELRYDRVVALGLEDRIIRDFDGLPGKHLGRLGIWKSVKMRQVLLLMHKNPLTQSLSPKKRRNLRSTAVRALSWRRQLAWSTDDYRQLGTMCRSLGRPSVAERLSPTFDPCQTSVTPLVGLGKPCQTSTTPLVGLRRSLVRCRHGCLDVGTA